MEPASRVSDRPSSDPAAGSSPARPEHEFAVHASLAAADPDAHPLAALVPLGQAARAFAERLNDIHRADKPVRETGEFPCGQHGANDQRVAEGDVAQESGAIEQEGATEGAAPIIHEDSVADRKRGHGYDCAVRRHVSFRLAQFIDMHVLRSKPPAGPLHEVLDGHLRDPWTAASLQASQQERWTDEWRERFCQWWHRLLFPPMWSRELVRRREGGWIRDSEAFRPMIDPEQGLEPRRIRDVLLCAFDKVGWMDPRRSFVDATFPARAESVSTNADAGAADAHSKPAPKEPLATWLSEDAWHVLATIRRADPTGERALRLLWAAMSHRDQLRAAANRDSRRAQRARATLPAPST